MGSNIDIQMVARRELENDQRSSLNVEQAQLMEMFYRLETAVGNAHASDVKDGDWNYIPFSHLMFYRHLKEAVAGKNLEDLRYLELGCGLGTKLVIAHQWVGIGSVTGIEVVPVFATIARYMLCGAGTILEMNVRDFTDYHEYDVIYSFESYQPLSPPDVLEWIEKVRGAMKPGAILLQGAFSRAKRPLTSIQTWVKP
jgi:hypothetical protein